MNKDDMGLGFFSSNGLSTVDIMINIEDASDQITVSGCNMKHFKMKIDL